MYSGFYGTSPYGGIDTGFSAVGTQTRSGLPAVVLLTRRDTLILVESVLGPKFQPLILSSSRRRDPVVLH